jgi:aldehyde dehydrogenase (NAD+)
MLATNTAKTASKYDFENLFKAQKTKSIALRTAPISSRIEKLKKLKRIIEDHKEDIRTAVYQDFKKPAAEADLSETYIVISEINHALKKLKSWASPKSVAANITFFGTSSTVKAEPKGVCLIIAPWNYPVNLLLGPAVSAIAAGNTLIMKPSEITLHTAALMSKLINENFESDELHVVEGGVEETTALLSLPFDHIFFTGSTAVGKVVMKAASEHLTSVTLELGGKSPAIVDATAHIKDAAEKIVWGKWVNNGQTCIAPDYVMVHESVRNELIEEMKKCISQFFIPNGETFNNSPFYSRVVSDKHFNRLAAMIEDAIDKGATLAIGGQVDASERLIEPTVLENVSEDSTLLLEEIFGPILPVNSFKNLDTVIDKINQNQKPLALYIFSKSKEVIKKVEGSTSSGSTCINDCVLQFMQPNLPFGGVNHSGIGKAHGHYGFLEFSNQKSILKQRIGLTSAKSLYPPYTSTKQKMIDFMMKYV